jgi:formylglycine-generating enzyme required for sulfatase activity
VKGGAFQRRLVILQKKLIEADPLAKPPARTPTDTLYDVSVSDFRLDRFEVTIGRFRKFLNAWKAGFRPAAGEGKHGHLFGGKGLADSSVRGKYETGWHETWSDEHVAPTDAKLQCENEKPRVFTRAKVADEGPPEEPKRREWTPEPAGNENVPVACASWFEAYAFCIWDGGFLPSEAEWEYAAAGGSEQRPYPWSHADTPSVIDCSYANYDYCVGATNDVGSESPKGDGKYGHADLAGNVREWTSDYWVEAYATPCNDCSLLSVPRTVSAFEIPRRSPRGGGFLDHSNYMVASDASKTRGYFLLRRELEPTARSEAVGFRCARAP